MPANARVPADHPGGGNVTEPARLAEAYRAGTAVLGDTPVCAADWFALGPHLTRLAGTERVAARLTAAVAACDGPRPRAPSDAPVRSWVEAFRHTERHALGSVVAWLLREWPTRFVRVATAADLWPAMSSATSPIPRPCSAPL